MLKILVIASTEHILKFKDQFSDSGFSLDYLIIEKHSSYDFGIFDQQHINIENEMAAIHKPNNEFQTLTQHDVLLKTQHQLRKLKYILYQSQKYKAQASVLKKIINQEASLDQVFSLDQSVDLILNSKSKKIHLEIKNSQVFEYDHIYIEDSHLTLKKLSNHFPNQKLYTYNDQQVFQMVGLQFQTNTDIGEYSFWLMADMNYNSIYDNFHYLKSYQKMIDVWAWLPVQQVLNSANVIYLQERVRKKIEKKYYYSLCKYNKIQYEPEYTFQKPCCIWFDIRS